jgi:hypothetical protein
MAAVLARADDDYDNVLAALQVGIPSGEQIRGAEASAAAYLVGIGEGCANSVSMIRQNVPLYVLLAPA